MNKRHDYHAFKNAPDKTPPERLSAAISQAVHADLSFSAPVTYLKFSLVHFGVGIVSLFFCPQFNLSLTGKKDIYYFLHQNLGHYGCTLACGALFLGFGAFFAALLLRPQETRYIRKSLMSVFLALAFVSLGLFFVFGAQIYLELTMPWLLGAVIGGAATFKVTSNLRQAWSS